MEILARPRSSSDSNLGRVGIIVSKRAIPLAVKRNGIKRVVREWFRCHRSLCTGWDYVVTFKYKSKTLSKKALNKQLNTLWRHVIES